MLTGGCFCGRVRYEADGAPFNVTISVRRSHFRLVSGEPTRFRSSGKATRSFCPECGTQIAFELDGADDEIDVTTSSLDDPNRVSPLDHTYASSRLAWVKLADGLAQFRESRERG